MKKIMALSFLYLGLATTIWSSGASACQSLGSMGTIENKCVAYSPKPAAGVYLAIYGDWAVIDSNNANACHFLMYGYSGGPLLAYQEIPPNTHIEGPMGHGCFIFNCRGAYDGVWRQTNACAY